MTGERERETCTERQTCRDIHRHTYREIDRETQRDQNRETYTEETERRSEDNFHGLVLSLYYVGLRFGTKHLTFTAFSTLTTVL